MAAATGKESCIETAPASIHHRTDGFVWSPTNSPASQSHDISSPVYPDRVIRPLPKRPIKSRLSSEQANSIVYPPVPPSSSPVFGSPYGLTGQSGTNPAYLEGDTDHRSSHDHDHVCGCGEEHSEGESDLEGEDYGSVTQRYFEPSSMQRFPRSSKATKVPPPGSSASSADGYESFENTNNKKKRKIPISGTGSYISDLSTNPPAAGAPSSSDIGLTERRSLVTNQQDGRSLSTFYSERADAGMPAVARGRYTKTSSRLTSHRQPLGPSPSSINNYQSSVPHRFKAPGASFGKAGVQAEQSNRKMSNSNLTEKHMAGAGKEKENFTFNSPSESSKKMGLVPEGGLSTATTFPQAHASVQHGIKGTAGMQKSMNASLSNNGLPPANAIGRDYQPPAKVQPAPESEEAARRNHRRELRLQVRQRRLQAESNSFHNPPGPNDIWVCEFCEYEAVFGKPPKHIIRQFEETQLKKQKQADDHKRLLEKAKKTSKKNRKSKSHSKHGAASTSHQYSQTQAQDPHYDDTLDHDLDGQSDDLFDPSYGDSPLLSDQRVPLDGSHFDTKDPTLTSSSGGIGGSGNIDSFGDGTRI